MENKILDYDQVLKKLKEIESKSILIKKENPIGYTTYNLPILHYTVGSGKNHIVLAGSQHGCEIITTDFLLKVMEKISERDKRFGFLRNNAYTLHFLPMLNPEGYLISTSAIRKLLPRDIPDDEAQEIYKDYLAQYRQDDGDCRLKLNTKIKRHQQYFGHIDPDLILRNRFWNVQRSLIKLYKENGIPEGTLAIWHSNGNGIDLNQNMPYNPKIQAMKEGRKLFSLFRYDNIETTKPGPIGCPMRGEEFKYEPENEALLRFLFSLKNDKNINLCAFLNYHSTGGLIYHKPCFDLRDSGIDEQNLFGEDLGIDTSKDEMQGNQRVAVMEHLNLEAIYNRKISQLYSSKTSYRIMETKPELNCFNDLLRVCIPGDILIELSRNSGNPLGPYVKEEYDRMLEDNINALTYTLHKIPGMFRIKNEYINEQKWKKKIGDNEFVR